MEVHSNDFQEYTVFHPKTRFHPKTMFHPKTSRHHSPFPILCLTALVVIGLAACSSGGLGDIFGGDDSQTPTVAEVRGTVDFVDPDARFVDLERVSSRSSLQNGSSDTFRLWVREDTRVTYDGDVYRPADLEPGDQVVARVEEQDGRWYASEDIQVSYDSSPGRTADTGTDTSDTNADFRGTVLAIDTRNHTIELDRDRSYISRFSTGRQSEVIVLHYDARTRVRYEGNFYEPENIERGDHILVDAELASNRWIAVNIEVVASVRDSRGS